MQFNTINTSKKNPPLNIGNNTQMWLLCFEHLSKEDLGRVASCCKKFKNTVSISFYSRRWQENPLQCILKFYGFISMQKLRDHFRYCIETTVQSDAILKDAAGTDVYYPFKLLAFFDLIKPNDSNQYSNNFKNVNRIFAQHRFHDFYWHYINNISDEKAPREKFAKQITYNYLLSLQNALKEERPLHYLLSCAEHFEMIIENIHYFPNLDPWFKQKLLNLIDERIKNVNTSLASLATIAAIELSQYSDEVLTHYLPLLIDFLRLMKICNERPSFRIQDLIYNILHHKSKIATDHLFMLFELMQLSSHSPYYYDLDFRVCLEFSKYISRYPDLPSSFKLFLLDWTAPSLDQSPFKIDVAIAVKFILADDINQVIPLYLPLLNHILSSLDRPSSALEMLKTIGNERKDLSLSTQNRVCEFLKKLKLENNAPKLQPEHLNFHTELNPSICNSKSSQSTEMATQNDVIHFSYSLPSETWATIFNQGLTESQLHRVATCCKEFYKLSTGCLTSLYTRKMERQKHPLQKVMRYVNFAPIKKIRIQFRYCMSIELNNEVLARSLRDATQSEIAAFLALFDSTKPAGSNQNWSNNVKNVSNIVNRFSDAYWNFLGHIFSKEFTPDILCDYISFLQNILEEENEGLENFKPIEIRKKAKEDPSVLLDIVFDEIARNAPKSFSAIKKDINIQDFKNEVMNLIDEKAKSKLSISPKSAAEPRPKKDLSQYSFVLALLIVLATSIIYLNPNPYFPLK